MAAFPVRFPFRLSRRRAPGPAPAPGPARLSGFHLPISRRLRWLATALVLATGPAGCGNDLTPPEARTAAVEIFTEPGTAAASIEIDGPESRSVRADRSPPGSGTRIEESSPGYALVEGLRPGAYTARVRPDEEVAYFVVRGSAEFEVGPGDTARVTFVVPPASGTLAIGDTVAGPVSAPSGSYGNGFRLALNEGDTLDLRLTVAEHAVGAVVYRQDYRGLVYGPEGGLYGGPTIEYADGGEPYPGAGHVTLWPRVAASGAGPLTIVVEVVGDNRGSPPEWFGLATRRSGTVVRAFLPSGLSTGPWDRTVRDTVWIWNAGAGSADFSISSPDGRASFEPDAGALPAATEDPDGDPPPPDARPVGVRIDDGGSDPWSRVPIRLGADGDNWGDSEVGIDLRLHDPRLSLLFGAVVEERDTAFVDVALHPDGSAILATKRRLLRLDLETGAAEEIPSVLDRASPASHDPDPLRLAVGPDGSIYILFRSSPELLWRIGPAGSEELLVAEEEFTAAEIFANDVAAGTEGEVYLAAASGSGEGLWSVDATGTLSFLGTPDEPCCDAVAFDPSTGSVYLATRSSRPRIVAFDPATGSFAPFSPAAEADGSFHQEIRTLTVGRSGRVYGTGDLSRLNVLFAFDPAIDTWEEEVIGPPWLGGVAVAEGRLVGTISGDREAPAYSPDHPLVAFTVDDGPASP